MKANRTKFGLIVIPFLLAAAWPSPARADGVTLTLSSVTAAAGSTVTVDGTITNTGSTNVFLNAENFTLGTAFFGNGDVTDFFLNAPLSLSVGGSSGLLALFTFDIAPGTPPGKYGGNFLDIVGGPGSSDQNLLGGAGLTVTVTSGASIPEPGTLPLAGAGLLALAASVLLKKLTPSTFGESRPSL